MCDILHRFHLKRFEFYWLRFHVSLHHSWSLQQCARERPASQKAQSLCSTCRSIKYFAVTTDFFPTRSSRFSVACPQPITSDVTNHPGNMIHKDFSPTKLHPRSDFPLWRTVWTGGLRVLSVCRGDIEGDLGLWRWWLGWYQLFGSTMLWGLVYRQQAPVSTPWRVLRLRMEERPPIWRVAAIIQNKQSQTADKGWFLQLGGWARC